MTGGSVVLWFSEIGQEHNDLVGKKCANLGQMTRMALRVPPGFAVSIPAYRWFIEETGAAAEMARYVSGLGELKGQGIEMFERVSQKICGIILGKGMPAPLHDAIAAHYEALCDRVGAPEVAVSVRSAGTESRPGMFDTYLNVKGSAEVIERIKQVWASAYTARAVAFRVNRNIPVLGDEIGVAVVKMVNARSAGIGFSVNPITGDHSRVVVESNWGLGEGVVSGAESVDSFVVDKETLAILEKNIGSKRRFVTIKEQGVAWADVPVNQMLFPSLSEDELLEVVRLAKHLEVHMGCPQDIEWAIDSDYPFPESVFLLQARPAKTVSKIPEPPAARIADMMAKMFRK